MNLKNILQVNETKQTIYFMMLSIQNSRIGKTTMIETRSVVSWSWRKGLNAEEQRATFWGDGSSLS